MPKPYNNVIRQLIEHHPQDWGQLLGLPPPDKLLKVNAAKPYVLHIELHASYQENLAERFIACNIGTYERTGLPVYTKIFLLRPEADGIVLHDPRLKQIPLSKTHKQPFFTVTRLWEESPQSYLSGGLTIMPLAPLCNIPLSELPDVISQMARRIDAESVNPPEIWLAIYLLMGLRYDETLIQTLLQGAPDMKESRTYQAILAEGEAVGEARGALEGELRFLLAMAQKRIGEPPANALATLQSITDTALLEQIGLRLFEAETWNELMAGL